MKKTLFFVFVALVLLKVLLSLFVQVPLGFSDTLSYMEKGKVFHETLNLMEVEKLSKFPPLYPMIISFSFIFSNMEYVHLMIKIINALLSSLIIFPAYLLAKEFLDKKKSFMTAIIVGVLPPMFSFTSYFMSENLFYTLFLFTIYFIFKAFKEKKLKWNILSGVFISLCFMTRNLAIVLFPLVGILILINYNQIKNKLSLILASVITILPWIFVRGSIYGFKVSSILGPSESYRNSVTEAVSGLHLTSKLIWLFLYLDYLIIATAVIFFILSVYTILKYKEQNKDMKLFIQITLVSTFLFLIICSNHSGSYDSYTQARTLGRYIEVVLPLFILLGFIALSKNIKLPNMLKFVILFYMIITTPLILYDKFFPINNTSLVHVGILNYFLSTFMANVVLILTLMIVFSYLIITMFIKFDEKKIFVFFLLYFLVISLLNSSVIIYDSQVRWKSTEPVTLGIWFNKNNDKSNVLFDKKEVDSFVDETNNNPLSVKKRSTLVMAYWIRVKYSVDDITKYHSYNYIVTKSDLDLPVVKEGFDGTKIYKNE